MTTAKRIVTAQGRQIALHMTDGNGPTIVFCHGLRSDMTGTKAVYLEDWAAKTGHSFLRFDCSGHGESSGTFEEGCLGEWFEDAMAVITQCTDGPVILVGSSMGGWLSLLLARAMPERILGLVTIAAAPDFTEDGMWGAMSEAQRNEIRNTGRLEIPSEYGDPMVITRRLIEDGRDHLVLRSPLPLKSPTRFLHGTADADVDPSVALRLLDHVEGPDIQLTLVKDADHRFSSTENLALITAAIEDVVRGSNSQLGD